ACFSYQLKQCKGACIEEELAESYNARVNEAVAHFKEDLWPFRGAIAIKEQDELNKLGHYLVFNQWRQIGVAFNESSLVTVAKQTVPHSEFDTYKILRSFLKTKTLQTELIELESG
ncbi:MAG: DNA polymerase III subunit epsilon, partial [Tatlockia sp.]|nr:DNA polymerase III subunit epsilon [Tatlockia sp.]